MAGGAPFDCVNPEWLTSKAGALFEDTSPVQTKNVFQQPLFTPYVRPHSPMRTTYAPPRRPAQDPTLALSPTASPTRRPLNPTARPFTPPGQNASRDNPCGLRIETNVQQEHAVTPVTPRTPRIRLTPVDNVESVTNDAAIRAARQLPRNRRSSSPGQRPLGVQRRVSGRRIAMAPPPTSTPMSRVVSAPGSTTTAATQAGTSAYTMQAARSQSGVALLSPVRRSMVTAPPVADMLLPRVGSKTPARPIHPAEWLPSTHNVGFDGQLHTDRATEGAAPPIPEPARSTAASSSSSAVVQGRRPLVCDFLDCRHRAQGKTFKTAADLRKHRRNHLPASERPHGCPILGCAQRFWWPKDVDRHVEVVHNKTKAKCELCDAELCREDDLARHLATVHSGRSTDPRNWAAPSPSVSSVASFAMTPRSEHSYTMPSTPLTGPLTSFPSASRPKMPSHLASSDSIPEYELGPRHVS